MKNYVPLIGSQIQDLSRIFWALRTLSVHSFLGVVPVAIIACKPEIEPQPITIKINDSTGPPITGQAPWIKIVF
ncbi:hypothetical protein BCY89_27430 [Sphingobacterium siyangense]|uniref:Uncharacterized protein n=1 Tax=Sphingobacterium siyangense TaxID=459529 RepID=A0A420FXS8_9SPHI|nr:hypothetical protein BCY89_27430 [Sphingobacterium siyangense]